MRLAFSASASAAPFAPGPADQGLQLCPDSGLDQRVRQEIIEVLHQGIEYLECTVAGILLAAGREGERRALPGILGTLSEPRFLEVLLQQLLNSQPALAAIQQHSYYHHNGFRKLVLLQNASFKLRLHLWEARNEHHHENIHDHRWNFASRLLAGSFQTVIWTEDFHGSETRLDCAYTPARDGNAYQVREHGLVRLSQQATHTLRAGDLYFLPASTLHQVTDPGQGHTRSLMLTAAPVLAGCKLYAEHSIPEKDKENVPFTLAEIQAELRALLHTCSQPNALAA